MKRFPYRTQRSEARQSAPCPILFFLSACPDKSKDAPLFYKMPEKCGRLPGKHPGSAHKSRNAGVLRFVIMIPLGHVNASAMLALGIPDKYAMQRTGHATSNMLKIAYPRNMPEKEIKTVDKLNQYFANFVEKNSGRQGPVFV